MKFDLRRPCNNCPFRNDITPFIRPERAEEILTSQGDFPCHKTTDIETDDDGETIRSNQDCEHHCAGFLILLEKEGVPNQMMRISERLGMYDPSILDMDAPVYDSVSECVEAHEVAQSDALT